MTFYVVVVDFDTFIVRWTLIITTYYYLRTYYAEAHVGAAPNGLR